jgi:hypothetical protein
MKYNLYAFITLMQLINNFRKVIMLNASNILVLMWHNMEIVNCTQKYYSEDHTSIADKERTLYFFFLSRSIQYIFHTIWRG